MTNKCTGIGSGRWCKPGHYTWTTRELREIESYANGNKWRRVNFKCNKILLHRTLNAIRSKIYELRNAHHISGGAITKIEVGGKISMDKTLE